MPININYYSEDDLVDLSSDEECYDINEFEFVDNILVYDEESICDKFNFHLFMAILLTLTYFIIK